MYAYNSMYLGKIITIEKGNRLSKQFHRFKNETVFVLKGRFALEHGRKRAIMRPGEAFEIPPRTVHRFAAPYGRVTLLEVSTKQAHDVVRLEDDYGRAKESSKHGKSSRS